MRNYLISIAPDGSTLLQCLDQVDPIYPCLIPDYMRRRKLVITEVTTSLEEALDMISRDQAEQDDFFDTQRGELAFVQVAANPARPTDVGRFGEFFQPSSWKQVPRAGQYQQE